MRREPVHLTEHDQYRRIGVYSWGKGFIHRLPAGIGDMGSMKYFIFPQQALVISNIQAWEGAVAVSEATEEDHVASNRFLPYVSRGSVDIHYVGQFMKSSAGLSILQKASPGTAVRNRTLSRKIFEDSKIPLPELDEQHRIAARLDAVARAATYPSGTDILAAAKQAVWGDAAESSEAPLGSVVHQASRSRRVDQDATYRMLGVRWYGAGPFVRETVTGSDLKAKTVYDVEEGDLIYNRLFAWKGSFGLVGPALAGATVSNEFPTFTTHEDHASTAYVHAWLQRPEVWSVVEQQSTGSTPTSRNRFSIDNFLRLVIPLPSLDEQRRVVERLDAIDQVQDAMRRRDALAAALLPAARNEEFSRLVAQAG